MPTPPQFKEIILMNKGDKTITSVQEIQELRWVQIDVVFLFKYYYINNN